MSFFNYKDTIEEGDLVLCFVSRNDIKPINVTKGQIFNTRYGNFKHDEMIGMKYGEQMPGAKGYGFIHLLHPTPELWTISLPHRTQILYSHDSSYIMHRLSIIPGTRVIEAGTGSGSFTHSFARTIGMEGKLFTYEFHHPRYLEAKKEIEHHGIDINTFITHRDVCEDGFDINDIPNQFVSSNNGIDANAVFLDLPSPWTAIPHLNNVITKDSTAGICCFSPCIEQVDKTVRALQDNGWTSIEMVEVAGRRWEARQEMVRDVNDVVKRLKDIQSRRPQGIETKKVGAHQESDDQDQDQDQDEDHNGKREAKTDNSSVPTKLQNQGKGFNPFGKGQRIREGDANYSWKSVTKVETDIKSHTSYLTFAVKVPQKL